MNFLTMIVAFGVGCGVLAILVVLAFTRVSRRLRPGQAEPFVPRTTIGGLGLGNLSGPTDFLARTGQQARPHMTLGTVVMRPTPGLRLMSLGPSALVLILIWGPADVLGPFSPALKLLISAAIAYAVVFIASYEARYDENGIKAPNWLFQEVFYPWDEFISIRDDGHYLYKLRFDQQTLSLQKYLVGMPTFLTFVTELNAMHRRA